jgi:hypothetical protein
MIFQIIISMPINTILSLLGRSGNHRLRPVLTAVLEANCCKNALYEICTNFKSFQSETVIHDHMVTSVIYFNLPISPFPWATVYSINGFGDAFLYFPIGNACYYLFLHLCGYGPSHWCGLCHKYSS